jgi:hypothetical protein
LPLDPTIVQQLPTGAEDATDVGYAVIKHLTGTGSEYDLESVAADHESRIAFGEKKYGQRLKTDNGRDAVMDSYQELLDFLSYAMQAHLEGKPGFLELFLTVARIAATVRGRLGK